MTATALATSDRPSIGARLSEDVPPMAWRLLYLLWFVRLFRPEWVLNYFVPSLGFFRSLPTLMLAALVAFWLASPRKRVAELKWIVVYLVVVFVGILMAENIGRARPVLRMLFELWLIGAATISFANTEARVKALLKLWVYYYIYIAIWGIAGGGLVHWDNVLNEEDSFGPLMGLGVAFCSQYYEVGRGKTDKLTSLAGFLISIVGVIASFARGAFLALVATLAYRIAISRRVMVNIAFTIFALATVAAATAILFPAEGDDTVNAFWKEMATISEGTSEGTGEDRKVLWSVAFEVYKANPVFGVGAHNFGIVAPQYAPLIKDRGGRYNDPNSMWGRALHNGYFQILSEGGTIGVLSYAAIVISFAIANRRTRLRCRAYRGNSFDAEWFERVAAGVRLSMFTFLLNLFFYDITYYDWFWNLLLMNVLLSVRSEELSMTEAASEVALVPSHDADAIQWHPALGPRPAPAALWPERAK